MLRRGVIKTSYTFKNSCKPPSSLFKVKFDKNKKFLLPFQYKENKTINVIYLNIVSFMIHTLLSLGETKTLPLSTKSNDPQPRHCLGIYPCHALQ